MSVARFSLWGFSFVVVLVFLGCSQETSQSDSADESYKELPPPSDEECIAYAKKLQKAMKAPRPDLSEFLDSDRFFHQIAYKANTTEAERVELKREYDDDIRRSGGFVNTLHRKVQQGGHFHFLKLKRGDNTVQALFRLHVRRGGVNYYGFRLVKSKAGKIFAEDIYAVLQGEMVSATHRRLYRQRPTLKTTSPRNDQSPVDSSENARDFLPIERAIQRKDTATALRLIRELPEPVRHSNFALLLIMRATTSNPNSKEFLAAYVEHRKRFPNQVGADIAAMDFLFFSKRYDDLINSLDRISHYVGGDPYLLLIRSMALRLQGKNEKAHHDITLAYQGLPEFQVVYWPKIDLDIRHRKFAEALATMKEMERRFIVTKADLSKNPNYADFLKFKPYQEWQRSRSGKR